MCYVMQCKLYHLGISLVISCGLSDYPVLVCFHCFTVKVKNISDNSAHTLIRTHTTRAVPRDCKVSQAACPMYISCTFKMRFFSFSIGVRTLTPGDLGNNRSQTIMSNTKVVHINFPYISRLPTTIPLRDMTKNTFLTFRLPTTLTFDLKF